jgi:hypothetical protein
VTVERGTWPAYAAAAVALSFGLVSVYWAAGGMAGLGTLGGTIETKARARETGLVAATWAAAALKLVGVALALALVRPWGSRVSRPALQAAAWVSAVVLTLYGISQTVAVALVWSGVSENTQGLPAGALRWRMLLWEPWFLVWGLLLGLAAWRFSRPSRPRR